MNFIKPESLNGAQLKAELKQQEIDVQIVNDLGDGFISFDVIEAKETKAKSIVENHVGVDSIPSLSEKLQSIGLNIDELKAALA